jgi:hypothetical protein
VVLVLAALVVPLGLVEPQARPVGAPSGALPALGELSPAQGSRAQGSPAQGSPAQASPDGWPAGSAATAEADLPGTPGWQRLRVGAQHDIEGYADHDSVLPGTPVRLFVSTVAGRYRIRAFRMGWYGGVLARQVWASDWLPGSRQPAARVYGPVHRVVAPWRPTATVPTAGWPPGDYLLRLDADRGALGRFVPLVVRSASAAGAVVIVNADTTWQAYNDWGGYSLYHGPDGGMAGRSRAVTFDRPYAYGAGAADFLGAELPLVSLAERIGLPLAYLTDTDLHRDPDLLDGARALISLGHDEYWSPAMRAQVTRARDSGMNVAFLGANAIYRKIRFAGSRLGPDRVEINYKGDADPVRDPAQVTTQWRSPPSDDPESSLTGTFYQCNPVRADMVITDPDNWLFAGLHLRPGTRLRGLVGSEYDRVDLGAPTPRPIEILAHSPLRCAGTADHADMAYYSTPSGAGVLDVGTSDWVAGLDSRDGLVRSVVLEVTANLLTVFAAGPAGLVHPARDNAARYYRTR